MKKSLLLAPALLGLSLWLAYPSDGENTSQSSIGSKALIDQSKETKAPSPAQLNLSIAKDKGAMGFQSKKREQLSLDPQFKRYIELKKKALLTDQEKNTMETLIKDEALIIQLGSQLRSEYLTDEATQFAALDMVFDALKAGSPGAQKSLKGIIQDSFIEDPGNDFSQRQSLAELKAEVLYRWGASAPELDNEMRSWLPGSVSEKLWENVKRAHENNLLESDQST